MCHNILRMAAFQLFPVTKPQSTPTVSIPAFSPVSAYLYSRIAQIQTLFPFIPSSWQMANALSGAGFQRSRLLAAHHIKISFPKECLNIHNCLLMRSFRKNSHMYTHLFNDASNSRIPSYAYVFHKAVFREILHINRKTFIRTSFSSLPASAHASSASDSHFPRSVSFPPV